MPSKPVEIATFKLIPELSTETVNKCLAMGNK